MCLSPANSLHIDQGGMLRFERGVRLVVEGIRTERGGGGRAVVQSELVVYTRSKKWNKLH